MSVGHDPCIVLRAGHAPAVLNDRKEFPMLNPQFLAASIIALGITADPALAQDSTRQSAETQFQQLDGDNDGFVTRAEATRIPGVAERFAKFDANKDGKLDRGEFAALVASMK
jgi:Ca2+-binding EF-hand superfamily protein